jgi:UDP-N-acetylglucosamine:LPS N-acetylglucosamine transferase
VPLRKQFEQTHNAQFLTRSGLGECSEDPTREELARFLANLGAYRERLARHRIDPAEQVKKVLELLAGFGPAAG